MNDTKDEVRRLAELCVAALQERTPGRLDYSEHSLGAIEEVLAEASAYFDDLPSDQVASIAQRVGCYMLEVGHRQFGGEFFWHDELDQPVLVVGEPDRHIALVTWGKVLGRLSGDAGDNIPFFYSGFSERVASSVVGTSALYV